MSVKIRLMRTGKKKKPSYRVVVADSRKPRDGRLIEVIGHYSAQAEPSIVQIDADKAMRWLNEGAQTSETVSKLFEAEGIWERYKSENGRDPKAKVKISTTVRAPKNPAPSEDVPAEEASDDSDADDTESSEESDDE